MISAVIVKDSNGSYRGFQISGHAGYSEYGTDIICAAVSALAVNTINSVRILTDDSLICANGDADLLSSGLLKCRFANGCSKESELLMNSLVLGLEAIRDEYGDEYIKILFKEV